jgi:DNA polymerase-1
MASKRYKLGYQPGPAGDDKAVETAIAEDCHGADDWKAKVLQAVRDVKGARTRGKLYYKPYPLWVHPRDGMLHPQIINCGTATHRPTGSSPNFLQLTKKDGGKIRSVVRGRREDHIIISPDFSGQELRILASECRDPVLMDAYLPPEGQVEKDIHALTGSAIVLNSLKRDHPGLLELVKVDQSAVDYQDFVGILHADMAAEQWLDMHDADQAGLYLQLQKVFKQARTDAKPVNVLINYLGSAGTLSRNMGVPREIAQLFINMTFDRYARIGPWQQEMIRFAAQNGYTQTAYGTRRHVTDAILSRDGGIRSRMERQAVNFIIQGCAARILKIVLKEVWETRLLQETGASIIAPVYDELTASVPASAAAEYIQRLSEIMTVTPPGHPIPMKPETSLGLNWGNLVELGAYPSSDAIEEAIDKLLVAKRAAA